MAKSIVPTKFMETLKDTLIRERNLATSSANTYLSNLVLLNDKQAFNNLGFLKRNKEKIMEHLSQFAETTEQNYLTAIVSALSTHKDQHLYKTIYKYYQDILKEKLGVKDEEDTTEKTEKQIDNWVTWEECENKWKELREEVDKFKHDKSISKRNFETLINYLILSLYVLIPPRRNKDYLCMYVLIKDTPESELEPEIKNYLDLSNEELIFNQYKTKKFYGVQKEKVPEALMEVFRTWLKFHPTLNGIAKKSREVKLFVNAEGIAQNLDNFITLRLNKIFKKKVGCTMLRHVYITHMFGEEYTEMVKLKKTLLNKGADKTAEAMGHSMEMAAKYSKKE